MKVKKMNTNAAFAFLLIPAMSSIHQSFGLGHSRTRPLIRALPAQFSCAEAGNVLMKDRQGSRDDIFP